MENYDEYTKAKKLIKDGKYEEARRIIKRLYAFEPNDLVIKLEYARLLIRDENTEEKGIKLLEEELNTRNRNYALLEIGKLEVEHGNILKAREYFDELKNSEDKGTKGYALKEILYLEIGDKNYEEAYRLFEEIKKYRVLSESELVRIDFYLKYQLNLLTDADLVHDGYFCVQLINYSEDRLLNHLKHKLKIKERYNLSIDYDRLIEDTKKLLEQASPIKQSLNDKYILEYDYPVGKLRGNVTRKMEVITYSNTKQIITMTPTNKKCKKNEFSNRERAKVLKKESQIDKFNRKYNLN